MANVGKSFVAVLELAAALNARDITDALRLKIRALPFPYGGAILDNAMCVLLVVVTALLLSLKARSALKTLLGLDWHGLRAPALVLLAPLPCWIGLALQGGLASDVDPMLQR